MTKSRNIGRGGARPGAGRPKSKPVFELPEQRERYAAADTPLKFLLATMRDPLADVKRRDKAAIARRTEVNADDAQQAAIERAIREAALQLLERKQTVAEIFAKLANAIAMPADRTPGESAAASKAAN